MILCDAGPLVALIDVGDPYHTRCAVASNAIPSIGMISTWPCLTEAMYLLGRAGGVPAQDELWDFLAEGVVSIHVPDAVEVKRMRELMRQYANFPMDLADASLVSAAETLGIRRVFTVDRHFHAYRIHGRQAFDVTP